MKIASTWEGIRAAEIAPARRESTATSRCCSRWCRPPPAPRQGAFLISPFVGRILDWHAKAEGRTFTAGGGPRRPLGSPHLRLLQAARPRHGGDGRVLPQHGRDRGAGRLRPPDHRAAAAGAARRTTTGRCSAGSIPTMPRVRASDKVATDEPSFRFALNEDAMATEKLAEGHPPVRQGSCARCAVSSLRRSMAPQRLEDDGSKSGQARRVEVSAGRRRSLPVAGL